MFLKNESSDILSASFQQMISGMTDQIVEEMTRAIEERTRQRMSNAMSAVERMERRMRELEESMDRRMNNLEADMEEIMRSAEERIETRMRSLDERLEILEQAVPAHPEPENDEASAQLEQRMEGLETSVQQALGVVMPKVEELVAQLESCPPEASSASAAVSSRPDLPPSAGSSAPSAPSASSSAVSVLPQEGPECTED